MATSKKPGRKTVHRPASKIGLVAILVVVAIILVALSLTDRHNVAKTSAITPKTFDATPQSSPTPTPAASSAVGSIIDNPTPAPTGAPMESTANGTDAGSPLYLNDSDTSRCIGTAGQTCKIIFTLQNSSVTKTLAAQTIPNSGTATWSWQVSQIGLTPGAWIVQAVVVANGQNIDSTNSEVVYVHS